MSIDQIPRVSYYRLLISIELDSDLTGFGLRLSKSSLAHWIGLFMAGTCPTGCYPHWDRRTTSGTSAGEGLVVMHSLVSSPRGLHRL
jgi:hypothetical protein